MNEHKRFVCKDCIAYDDGMCILFHRKHNYYDRQMGCDTFLKNRLTPEKPEWGMARQLFDVLNTPNYTEVIVTIQEPHTPETVIRLNYTHKSIYYPNEKVISIKGEYTQYSLHENCIRNIEVKN